MKSLHKIKLDIFKVSYRLCRPYQEKIDDFYDDGGIRFQWDMIKQAHMLRSDQTLPAICGDCPLNLYYTAEGCQGDLEGLAVFLKVLARFKPDAELLKYELFDDILDVDAVRRMLGEILDAENFLEKMKWPIAQVFYGGVPVSYQHSDGLTRYIFYEWEGEEEETFTQGSEGYFWGRSQDGIVVKDNFGNRITGVFKRLYREGFGVYGEYSDGKLHTFVPVMGHFPSWDDIEPGRKSELIATELAAPIVFYDVLQILKIFSQEALKNNTGIHFVNIT